MPNRLRSPLWVALLEVNALPTNTEHPELHAFVSGITPATTIKRALEKFKKGLHDWDFELTNVDRLRSAVVDSKGRILPPPVTETESGLAKRH